MSQVATVSNPFLLMVSPEVVLAAMEKSERLGALNRHLCRPLDRPQGQPGKPAANADSDREIDAAPDEEPGSDPA
jgi:hypothetical protein